MGTKRGVAGFTETCASHRSGAPDESMRASPHTFPKSCLGGALGSTHVVTATVILVRETAFPLTCKLLWLIAAGIFTTPRYFVKQKATSTLKRVLKQSSSSLYAFVVFSAVLGVGENSVSAALHIVFRVLA